MKKSIINSIIAVALTASLASCGDKWLETDMYSGVDSETALDNPTAVQYALNGTYYQLQRYYFAGNYSTILADIASDITYCNTKQGHFNSIYTFTYQPTDTYLLYIWSYGYKVVDNSARVVQAAEKLIPGAEGLDEAYLNVFAAEARCLRAYANLQMVNTFCHQAKVNGQDFSGELGLVLVDEPIEAYAPVKRATVGETYAFIIDDLEKAIAAFEEYGDRAEDYDNHYFGPAAAYGLLARANMYYENWQAAAAAAQAAIETSGVTSLAYTGAEYAALYRNDDSNTESFFSLGIDEMTNWSANSLGTLFTTYGYSPSPYLFSLFGPEDCRLSIMYWNGEDEYNNNFSAGKFYFGGGNPASANNFLINAPEMFLIQAEAYANLNNTSAAQEALFTVAHRNPAIASTADLPSSKDELLAFVHDERARELFQEGFRLWDLRRWNVKANLYATGAPEVNWLIKNADCGNIVFPIPADEINAGFGVVQNPNWQATRPM